jgi:hypothetical protein
MVLLSLTLISLPLPLVPIPLIPYQSTRNRANSSPNEGPLGGLILVVMTNHPTDYRTSKPPQDCPVSRVLLPQSHRTNHHETYRHRSNHPAGKC